MVDSGNDQSVNVPSQSSYSYNAKLQSLAWPKMNLKTNKISEADCDEDCSDDDGYEYLNEI